MSKATDALRSAGIYNSWGAARHARDCGGIGVYVERRPAVTGRVSQPAAWQVIDVSKRTDPGGHFLNNGLQTFAVYSRSFDPVQAEAALAWAEEWIGETVEWVKVPGLRQCWFPATDAAIITATVTRSSP